MDNSETDVTIADTCEQNVRLKKGRIPVGKSLFPWKSKHGPDLKKGLIKVIYLHGMHLGKGADRLPKMKNLTISGNITARGLNDLCRCSDPSSSRSTSQNHVR